MNAGGTSGTSERLTVLRTVGDRGGDRFATKRWVWNRTLNEWRLIAYSAGSFFTAEERPIASLHDLAAAVEDLRRDPRAFVVRGEFTPEVRAAIAGNPGATIRRHKHALAGAAATLAEAPRRQMMLDIDGWPLPGWADLICDPEAVVEAAILDLLPAPFHDAACFWQLSSSAGFKGGVLKAHLWFWLAEPTSSADLKAYFQVHAPQVDRSVFGAAQPLYIADPIIEGGHDPLPRRTGWRKAMDNTVVLPPIDLAALHETIRATRHRAANGAGIADAVLLGLEGLLALVGDGDGREGFHVPLRTATMIYARQTAPGERDDAALKDAVRQAIAGAPCAPHRSRGELERYGSDGYLDDLIEGAFRRIADSKREAPPPPPVAPTYPDLGVPLDAAWRLAGDAITGFAAKIEDGAMPQLLLRMTVGSGKTAAAIEALPALLAAGRAAGRGPVLFTHPRHALGDEIAERIRARHPAVHVAIWRGMAADDPANPGRKMCQDPELPRAAKAAGLPATHGCRACPLAPACAYLAQQDTRDVDVWIAPHQVLFLTPFAAWPRATVDEKTVPVWASAVIVDEDLSSAGLAGLNPLEPVQLALSALEFTETPNLVDFDRDRLLNLRKRGRDAIEHQPEGGLFREPLVAAELHEMPGHFGLGTVSAAREWAKLEWLCKPKVKLAEEATRADALAAYEAAAGQGFTRLRPILATRIEAFLAAGDTRSVNLTMDPAATLGREQGTGPAVRFAWRQDFHDAWRNAPLLFLDATGRPEILRLWAPALEVVDIEVQAPHQHVVQAADRSFSRTMLTAPANVAKLADILMVETAAAPGTVLAVAQQAVERLLRPLVAARGGVRDPIPEGGSENDPATYRFPAGAVLHLAHHGDVTGSNAWQDAATVVAIGRPATNRLVGERRAEVLAGRGVDLAADAKGDHWPTTPAAIRMADSTGRAIARQPCHPDPLVEAGRWAVTEGAVLQAIGRPRGVRRTAATPVRVVILAAVALPVTVAELTTWDDLVPDRLATAAAEAALNRRAMPLAPADLSKARPDLWETAKAAKLCLERGKAVLKGLKPLISISYKAFEAFQTPNASATAARYRKGLRGRWSAAWVPTEGGREALEAVLGCPVAAFELVNTSAAHSPEIRLMPELTAAEREAADARHAEAVEILVAYGMAVPPSDDLEDYRNNFTCVMPDPDDPLPEVTLLTPWRRVAWRQARDAARPTP